MLKVYIDFKCPASFLALGPVLDLQNRTGIEISWHPFCEAERDLPDGTENDATALSHYEARRMNREQTFKTYAALQGITLTFPEEPKPTDLALGALSLIKGDKLPFIKLAFGAYWTEHFDLCDPIIVNALLREVKVDLADWEEIMWLQAAEAAQKEAEFLGIVGAPAFVIAKQLFIGREHLPWIEEIISQS